MPKIQKKKLPTILLNGKDTKRTHFLKKIGSVILNDKNLKRKTCCWDNVGSILLNDVNTKRKNMFACPSNKW